jgi:hypothetical protein
VLDESECCRLLPISRVPEFALDSIEECELLAAAEAEISDVELLLPCGNPLESLLKLDLLPVSLILKPLLLAAPV